MVDRNLPDTPMTAMQWPRKICPDCNGRKTQLERLNGQPMMKVEIKEAKND